MSDSSDPRHLRLGDVENDSPDVAHNTHEYPDTDCLLQSQFEIRIRIGQIGGAAKGATMDITALVNALVTEAKMTQQEIADAIGTAQSNVARIKNARQDPAYTVGLRIIELAGQKGLLTNRKGTDKVVRQIELRGRMVGSDTVDLVADGCALQQIDLPFDVPADCYAFIVEADGLTPRARKGDLIVVGPSTVDLSQMINSEGIFFLDDGRCIYGMMLPGTNAGLFTILRQHNQILPDVKVVKMGPFFAVVAAGRWQTLE